MLLWTTFIYARFFFKSRTLYYDVHHKYNFYWTLLFIILCLSLLMIMSFEFITMVYGQDDYDDEEKRAYNGENQLRWVQFFGFIMPPVALVLVSFPQDLFVCYNKFPEQATRISII